MPFRYRIRTPDGDDVGEIELDEPATTGDEIRVTGQRRMLIQAVMPTERVSGLVDTPLVGFLLVEPVD